MLYFYTFLSLKVYITTKDMKCMRIAAIKQLPKSAIARLRATGIKVLNPVQVKAIKAGLLNLDKSFVISSPTASGKCLAGDCKIQLANGRIAKIGEVVEHELKRNRGKTSGGFVAMPRNLKILTLNKNLKLVPKKVLACWKLAAPRRLIKLRTASGKTLVTTPEHPFLVLKDGKLQWRRADSINAGERIAAARKISLSGNKTELDISTMLKYLSRPYVARVTQTVSQIVERIRNEGLSYNDIAARLTVGGRDLYRWRKRSAIPLAKFVALAQLARIEEPYALIDFVSNGGISSVIRLPKRVTPDLLRFVGLVAADGSIHLTRRLGFVSFTNTNAKMREDFDKLAKKLFGLKPVSRISKKCSPGIFVYSQVLAQLLSYFGVRAGKKSHKIVVPDFIMQAPLPCVRSYIRALFDCDGSVYDRAIEYGTDSAMLADTLRSLLLRFGIISILKRRYTVGKHRYRLLISSRANFKLFASAIGFSHPTKRKILHKLITEAEIGWQTFRHFPASFESYVYGWRANVSRSNLQKLLANPLGRFNTPTLMMLRSLANSDIFWDIIAEKETLSGHKKRWVYDLTVDRTHNFIAEDIIAHNTLIAELLMIKAILKKRVKAIYTVPLRALANQKYENFKKRWGPLGIKVAISTGDYDSADHWLADYDIVILTTEKCDSLMRHRAPWLAQVGVAVIDECHMIQDPDRGPTQEIVIARLRRLNPQMLFVFLSATIKNAAQLAEWINAQLITSDWRPVKLHEGVYDGKRVKFTEKPPVTPRGKGPAEVLLADDTARIGKQALVFAATRRSAEAIAERCGEAVRRYLKPKERKVLAALAHKVERALERPTKQCKRLADCVRNGTAFHHAGLARAQRIAIEHAFLDRLIKIIGCTPSLAYGIDMPAYRAVIRDARRYYPGYGFVYIPVLEYEQQRGRAGRPKYDKEGESILIAHNPREAQELFERYVLGEPEEITSKLAAEPVLRLHSLALIADYLVRSEAALCDFFSATFYGYQIADIVAIRKIIRKVLRDLVKWRFVVQIGQELRPTRIGKRISELYIDPATAARMIEALERYKITDFGLLQLIAATPELAPSLRVRSREWSDVADALAKREQLIMGRIPSEFDPEFEDFLASFKTALLLEAWANEAGEDTIYTKFRVTPGELYVKLENADWLLYAASELALLLAKREAARAIRKMRLRLYYGVKEELLPLVRLKGIGRVRSRLLFDHGYKSLRALRKATKAELARLIGLKIARSIKEQLGE
jgi:helicase